jgi:hypothetical protein
MKHTHPHTHKDVLNAHICPLWIPRRCCEGRRLRHHCDLRFCICARHPTHPNEHPTEIGSSLRLLLVCRLIGDRMLWPATTTTSSIGKDGTRWKHTIHDHLQSSIFILQLFVPRPARTSGALWSNIQQQQQQKKSAALLLPNDLRLAPTAHVLFVPLVFCIHHSAFWFHVIVVPGDVGSVCLW